MDFQRKENSLEELLDHDVSRNPDRDASQSQKLYSDATLFILSNKNNPITKIHFYDMFPLSLSGLDYRQDATDVEYMQANATFAYMIYEFEDV